MIYGTTNPWWRLSGAWGAGRLDCGAWYPCYRVIQYQYGVRHRLSPPPPLLKILVLLMFFSSKNGILSLKFIVSFWEILCIPQEVSYQGECRGWIIFNFCLNTSIYKVLIEKMMKFKNLDHRKFRLSYGSESNPIPPFKPKSGGGGYGEQHLLSRHWSCRSFILRCWWLNLH